MARSTHLLSIDDVRESSNVFRLASRYESGAAVFPSVSTPKRVLTMFLEPSTRTRLSFEAAALNLGLSVISVPDVETTRIPKGESIEDTARVCSNYADVIVLRTPNVEDLHTFARYATVPVINAGNGHEEHPTQALIDVHAIQRHCAPKLDVLLLGDPTRMRAMNSFSKLIHQLPQWFSSITTDIDPSRFYQTPPYDFSEYDVIYMNSRLLPGRKRELIETSPWIIDENTKLKPTAKVLHPLARGPELGVGLDYTDHALYWEQARLAVYVRMAVLYLILEGTL